MVVGELLAGFAAGSRRSRNVQDLDEFLENPVVEEVPIDRHVARTYAEIVTDLRSAGTPLPSNDLWIAAASVRAGAPLLTFDRHFELITRLGTVLLQSESAEN